MSSFKMIVSFWNFYIAANLWNHYSALTLSTCIQSVSESKEHQGSWISSITIYYFYSYLKCFVYLTFITTCISFIVLFHLLEIWVVVFFGSIVVYPCLTKTTFCFVFSSPEHKVLMVRYCDRSLSVGVRRPSCVNFFT